MLEIARTARQLNQYGFELLHDRAAYGVALEEVVDADAYARILDAQSLTGISAMGLLSKMAYDVAIEPGERNPDNRWNAAILGGFTLLASDVIDDEIDRPEMPLEEKFRYLDAVAAVMAEGAPWLAESQYPVGGEPQAVRASFVLASYIHNLVDSYDGGERINTLFPPLVESVKLQAVSPYPLAQLALTLEVGRQCGRIGSVAVEVVEAASFPEADTASGALGAYAECANLACEIKGDVEEGSVSYVSVYLDANGDTPHARRQLKTNLLLAGKRAFAQGIAGLNKNQTAVMKAGKALIDVKYRVLGNLAKPHPAGVPEVPAQESAAAG